MERDKFLTEAMGGKQEYVCMVDGEAIKDCVLQETSPHYLGYCSNIPESRITTDCDEWKLQFMDGVIDFSTWEGFGKLWEWAQEQEWWGSFCSTAKYGVGMYATEIPYVDINLINPDRFANAVYEFLKERT